MKKFWYKIRSRIILNRWNTIVGEFLKDHKFYKKHYTKDKWLLWQMADILRFKAAFPTEYDVLNGKRMYISDIFWNEFKDKLDMLGMMDYFYAYSKKDQKMHLIVLLLRPGCLIGKGGERIDRVQNALEKQFNEPWTIDIWEVRSRDNLQDGFWDYQQAYENY